MAWLGMGFTSAQAEPNQKRQPAEVAGMSLVDLSPVANLSPRADNPRTRLYLHDPNWQPPTEVAGIPLNLPAADVQREAFFHVKADGDKLIPVNSRSAWAGAVVVHAGPESVDFGHAGWSYVFHFTDGTHYDVPVRQGYEVATFWKEPESIRALELWRGNNGSYEISVQALPVSFPAPKAVESIEVRRNEVNGASAIVLAVTGLQVHQDVDHLLAMIEEQAPQNAAPATSGDTVSRLVVQWDAPLHAVNPMVFGTNLSGAFSRGDHPHAYVRNRYRLYERDDFRQYMRDTDFPLLRLHSSSISNAISDAENDRANVQFVIDSLHRVFAWRPEDSTGEIIFNIPRAPNWLAELRESLPRDEYEARYAAFCAEVAKAVKERFKYRVRYWEPVNELERRYQDNRKALWSMWVLAAQAIRKADPDARLVGPSLSWPDSSILRDFIQYVDAVDPDLLDVISWHRYSYGRNRPESSSELLSTTNRFYEDVVRVRKLVEQLRPSRKTKLHVGEFNISYAWQPHEPRQQNHVGAAWYASVLQHMIRANLDMATNWHLDGTGFGMLDEDPANEMFRPAAHLYAHLIRYFRGQACEVAGTSSQVEALAARDGAAMALLVVHKGESSRDIRINLGEFPGSDAANAVIHGLKIDERGTTNLKYRLDSRSADIDIPVAGVTTVILWSARDNG